MCKSFLDWGLSQQFCCCSPDSEPLLLDALLELPMFGLQHARLIVQFEYQGTEIPGQYMAAGFSFLVSYENMGVAEVRCVQGCLCNPASFSTSNPSERWSMVHWAFVMIEVSSCLLT